MLLTVVMSSVNSTSILQFLADVLIIRCSGSRCIRGFAPTHTCPLCRKAFFKRFRVHVDAAASEDADDSDARPSNIQDAHVLLEQVTLVFDETSTDQEVLADWLSIHWQSVADEPSSVSACCRTGMVNLQLLL